MYVDDIKLFAKNEKELETLIQAVRIYSQDIGLEFGLETYTMLMKKSGKRHLTDGMELTSKKKNKHLERSEKGKPTNTWGYWKLTPSNKWRREKKLRKSISGEPESNLRQNCIAGTLSKV